MGALNRLMSYTQQPIMPNATALELLLNGGDAFTAAAQRTRNSVRPEGGRREGLGTMVPESVIRDLMTLPARAGRVALDYGDPTNGTYNPAPIMEAALTATTGGVPFAQAGALGSAGGRAIIESIKPTKDLLDAYDLGRRVSAIKDTWKPTAPGLNFHEHWGYGHIPELKASDLDKLAAWEFSSPTHRAFYEAGERGYDPPTWQTGTRVGAAPKRGVSWNHADDRPEMGVSMASVDHPDFKNYQWADMGIDAGRMERPTLSYEGWLTPFRGSDNEPLMVGLKEIIRGK